MLLQKLLSILDAWSNEFFSFQDPSPSRKLQTSVRELFINNAEWASGHHRTEQIRDFEQIDDDTSLSKSFEDIHFGGFLNVYSTCARRRRFALLLLSKLKAEEEFY